MNERIDELIALAALGELTPAETAELDAAIAADPQLAVDLADALTSAAMLQASPAEEPPPRLRASVLDAIARTPQDGATQDGATPWSADGAVPVPALDGDREIDRGTDDGTSWVRHTDTDEPRHFDASRRRRWYAPLLAAAAVLALVAGGVVISTNGGEDDPIAAVVDAPDAQAETVSGSLGELQFVYSADEDAAVLIGDSIDPAPEDATYQLWLVSDGVATSIGTFDPDSNGVAELRADGVDPTGSTIGITVEPAGGSEQPTLPLVAQSA